VLEYAILEGKTKRRLWHILGTPIFPLLSLFLSRETIILLLLLGAAIFLSFDLLRLSVQRLNDLVFESLGDLMKAQEQRSLNGSTCVLLSELTCFYFFERDLAFASLLFLAIGDPLTAIVMERLFGTRSTKGSVPAFFFCLLFCLCVGLLVRGLGLRLRLLEVAIGSLSASLASTLPLRLDDNISIPLSSAIAMHLVRRL
jgi:dolichol kinase